MHVLVLGSTGFVGQQVLSILLERQYTVWCLVRTEPPSASVHVIRGSVESQSDIAAAIGDSCCDVVINLAGVYAWWLPDPQRFEAINVQGVANILGAIAQCSIDTRPRLVHVSTVLAYGRPQGRGLTDATAFDEDAAPGPTTSRYAASKQAGDDLVRTALASGAASGCICFLACCVGADPKLMARECDVMRIRDLVDGSLPAVISSGATFTYVYVKDAAEAIVRASAMHDPAAADGACYLIGEGRLRTSEYYAMIEELCGTPRPRREVPAWLAMLGARILTRYADQVTRQMPTAPLDLVRTASSGTLLFDAGRTTAALGMKYTPIRTAFAEAIDYITDAMTGSEAMAEQAAEREALVDKEM